MDTLLLALRVVVSLGVVIGAIWFVQRRVNRGGSKARRAGKPLAVVARQNLGPKASIAVIEFGGRRLLLGVTEHGVAVLGDSEAPEPALAEQPVVAEQPVGAERPGPALAAVTRRAASKQNSRDFAQALSTATEPAPRPTTVRAAKDEVFAGSFPQPSVLGGSILSASTWKQAWTAVRGGH